MRLIDNFLILIPRAILPLELVVIFLIAVFQPAKHYRYWKMTFSIFSLSFLITFLSLLSWMITDRLYWLICALTWGLTDCLIFAICWMQLSEEISNAPLKRYSIQKLQTKQETDTNN